MDLKGKVAIITGGGKGLGRVISLKFAQAGADLVLISRSKTELENVAAEAEKLGRKALVHVGDASLENVVQETVAAAVNHFGQVDILVNNAGIAGPIAPVDEIPLASWDQALAVNLTSYFLFCKYVIPVMKKQGNGSVINISSLLGLRGFPERTSYCATKWGVIGMSRALAYEVGQHNIRVNVICPGAVEGERITSVIETRAAERGVSFAEMLDLTTRDTPLRRLVDPAEVAAAAVFLASDAASGISGEEILVSGGRR